MCELCHSEGGRQRKQVLEYSACGVCVCSDLRWTDGSAALCGFFVFFLKYERMTSAGHMRGGGRDVVGLRRNEEIERDYLEKRESKRGRGVGQTRSAKRSI